MNLFKKLSQALHESQQRRADQLIRRYRHLLAEQYTLEHHIEAKTAAKQANWALEWAVTSGEAR